VRSSAGPAGAGPSEFASAIKPRGFFATPSYLRLWLAGGWGCVRRIWSQLLRPKAFRYRAGDRTARDDRISYDRLHATSGLFVRR